MTTLMTRLRLSAALTTCLLAGSALADLPAALDRAPKGSVMAIGVRNVAHVQTRLEAILKKFDAPVDMMMGELSMLLDAEGFNKQGSLAFVMLGDPAKEDFDPENAVMIVPVTDFAKFAKAMGGEVKDKTASLENMGEGLLAKDIGGGYVAMGPEASVKSFEGPTGQLASHKTALGASASFADTADVILISNLTPLNAMLVEQFSGMKEQMGMFAAAGGGNPNMEKGIQAVQEVMEAMARDIETGAIGISMTNGGVALDFGAQFRADSASAKLFQSNATVGNLISSLPNIPFMFAGAMDMSNPTVRAIIKWSGEMQQMGGEQPALAGLNSMALKTVDKVKGQAFIMGTTPAMFQTGLFANTLTFMETSDPAGIISAYREGIEKTNGTEVEGIKYATSYTAGAVEASGRKADQWSMKMDVDPNSDAAMAVQQAMMMFTGQSGELGGYILPSDKGVISTMSPNKDLLAKAIEASQGKGTLGEDPGIKSVAENLPANRAFEMYLGLKGVADTASSVMQMFAMPMPFEVADNMPPIGMAGTMSGGGMSFRTYLPMQVIDGIADAVKKLEQGEAPADNAQPEEDRRKPRF
jgi:hypothetical protein